MIWISDGISELVVGAKRDDDGARDSGAIWILFLNADGTVKDQQKISKLFGGFVDEAGETDDFGAALAPIGDFNQDGIPDIVVGTVSATPTENAIVWILFLNRDGTVISSQLLSADSGGLVQELIESDAFGSSLSPIADLNDDGIPELVVGTPNDDDGGRNTGSIRTLFMKDDGTVVSSRMKISAFEGGFDGDLQPSSMFGKAVTSIGDLNNDGIEELAVGAPEDNNGGRGKGAIWILFLDANGNPYRASKKSALREGGVFRRAQ